MFGRDVVVVHALRLVERLVEDLREGRADLRLLRRALDRRLAAQRGLRLRAQPSRVGDELLRQLLVEQREQQVLGVELRVAHPARKLLRSAYGLLALECQLVEVHLLLPFGKPLVAVEHEVAPVLSMNLLHLVAQLALQAIDARVRLLQLVLEAEHELDAREVETEVGRELLDQLEPLDVEVGVEACVAGGPLRIDEALLLVDAKRLRVHADDVGGDADHVARAVVHQLTLRNSSSSWRCFLFNRFGTSSLSRASTSPLPPPESFGAPRPRMRSNLPSSEPAGTLSETAPSGVGTWTVVPSAASGNDTGTVTSRSLPRRSYVSEGSTCVTT